MKQKNLIYAFLAVFILLVISWQISLHWNTMANTDMTVEIYLKEFDRKIQMDEESCFSMHVSSNYDSEKFYDLILIANENVVFREEVDVSKEVTFRKCVPATFLSEGENKIDILFGPQRLFYHTNVGDYDKTEPQLVLSNAENDKINIEISNYDEFKYAPVSIYVNNELDHKIYFSGSRYSGTEKISLTEGDNEIKVEFQGTEQILDVSKEPAFKMNEIFGLLIITSLLIVLAFFVFREFDLAERTAFTILSFFSVFIIVFFVLNITNLLDSFNFVLGIVLSILIIGIVFRKNLLKSDSLENFDWRKKLKEISPLLILLIGLLLFSAFFFNLFTYTYFGVWTSYYERQSRTVTGIEGIPELDEFSFLGTKPFGYMSGYFYLKPGITWVLGFEQPQSYAIIMLISQIAFMVSAFLFFRSYNLGKKAYIGVLAVLFGGFVFSDFSFNIRHVVSYSFLFLAMYLLRKKNSVYAGLILAAGTFIQTPLYLMFFVLSPLFVENKKEIKELIKTLAIGAMIAFVFFIPTLLSSGLPTQAKHDVWGYFWSIPLYGFLLDYTPILLLIALFIVPFLVFKKTQFNKTSLKVLAMLLIYLFIQVVISYRINVPATIAFGLFIAMLFPVDFFKDKFSEYSVSAFFAVCFTMMFVIIMSFYPVFPHLSNSFEYVSNNTSTDADFLNEPYLGHPFIHMTERKCTSDLAVEYANEQMIDDSFRFIKEEDSEILKTYDIEYVINRSVFLDEKPVGSNFYKRPMEYEFLDKVYSNEFMFVHWVDKEKLK